MITFLSCQDKICKVCVSEYLEIRIKEMQIHQIVCPVCGLPDLRDEVAAALYFNNLDIMVKLLVCCLILCFTDNRLPLPYIAIV